MTGPIRPAAVSPIKAAMPGTVMMVAMSVASTRDTYKDVAAGLPGSSAAALAPVEAGRQRYQDHHAKNHAQEDRGAHI